MLNALDVVLPTSLLRKCVALCHWWPTDWSVHFPATSDRWYLSQHFVRWTASTLTECSCTNTMTDVLPARRSAILFQSGRKTVSESYITKSRDWSWRYTELANTVTGSETIRLPYVGLHESYGVCTQGELERRTTPANSQCCKKQRCFVRLQVLCSHESENIAKETEDTSNNLLECWTANI